MSSRELPSTSELLHRAVEAIGGQPRAGQVQMAQALDTAINDGKHLLAQAGTGTGKSLAYLVPAIRHAFAAHTPSIIATATLALQHQIVSRDLPRIATPLGELLGRPPTWQVLKGRSHYLCRYRVSGGFAESSGDELFSLSHELPGTPILSGEQSATGQQIVRLREWADETTTGDRDDLDRGVSDAAWRQVSVSSSECLGSKCPMLADCFAEKARENAAHSDVVVTNHALLAIDAFDDLNLLPEHDLVIIDEAHELVDRVTSTVAGRLTAASIHTAAQRYRSSVGQKSNSDLDVHADALDDYLHNQPTGRVRGDFDDRLVDLLNLIQENARRALTAARAASNKNTDEAPGSSSLATSALSEIVSVSERLLAYHPDDVVWVTEHKFGAKEPWRSLDFAPLSVATPMVNKLFSESVVVLTSATLALGGTFDQVAHDVGLSSLGDDGWSSIDVGSPFDYSKQGMLYVAKHLPPPGRNGLSANVVDEIADLITAAGGRTLGLFSSRRAAEEAAERVAEQVDVPIVVQGQAITTELVNTFAEDKPTCLFGTLTLWQGVDVPGASCSLVIIDRMPFPRPDDPLASARSEAVGRAGGNGFMQVSAAHAALRMAQGAGRLIRADSDRGIVAVLDSRLATARYGEFVTRTMPPMWRTTDRDIVLASLERLVSKDN